MNKKRLSVVMAGAMLATSVAPVLAAEVTKEEKSANELGLLQEELRTLLESKVFANKSSNEKYAGLSVYAIYVNGKKIALDVTSTQTDWQNEFNKITSGDKVEVFSKGFKEVDGEYFHYESKTEVPKYTTETELKGLVKEFYTGKTLKTQFEKLLNSVTYDADAKRVVFDFKADTGMVGDEHNTYTIGLNDNQIETTKYEGRNSRNQAVEVAFNPSKPVTPGAFYGFIDKAEATSKTPISSELLREIIITPGGYDLTVEELYDGLMLTTKGHEFFSMLKEARAMRGSYVLDGNNVDSTSKITETNVAKEIKLINGKARFTVKLPAKTVNGVTLAEETYTITGLDEANAERLAKWMVQPLARVDILAGDNRYETAVEIAKEYVGIVGPEADAKDETIKDIVLVNGNALVDGLAAAPLAASLENGVHKVPVLLTEADTLPKATRAYLKELMADHLVGSNGTAEIHLVGGTSVLNKSLERELRALGFSVTRYDGDNREETSLAVAKAVGGNNAFVVGAEGEADAMSIAAVAAAQKTPIIVSKKGGITEDATYALRNQAVTVIGGENAVSKSDYKAIKAEAKAVQRISGTNRQATNAEIIKKYYKHTAAGEGFVGSAETVIVAKDGQRNKMELVDALAAANFASEKKAPIVLATSKLSKDQLNALALNAKESYALYQVGHGVSRDVVKTIATHLGLTNR